jgi:hypothetical protein
VSLRRDAMAISQYLERDYASGEIKEIYRWIQKKLGINKDYRLPEYKYEGVNENYHSAKYIVRLLTEKNYSGRALFYFRNMNDYITLSSDRHLNVKDGEAELFKPWGSSEFKNFKPSSVFQELEDEIIRINFITSGNGGTYSFDSYSDFTSWLLKEE